MRFNIKEWQDKHVKQPLNEANNDALLKRFAAQAKKQGFKDVGNKHDKYVDDEEFKTPIVTYAHPDGYAIQAYSEEGMKELQVWAQYKNNSTDQDDLKYWTSAKNWKNFTSAWGTDDYGY